jgi:PAS domain-containing protein
LGESIDILLRADAIKDKSGQIIGFINIHTDISDRKRAQEELAQRAIELARSNAETRTVLLMWHLTIYKNR